MSIAQPVSTDPLNSPDHSLLHRIIAADLGATVQSIGVNSDSTISILAGIKFPAEASASADANTLDDYEEGTWTGALVPQGGGTITMNAVTGAYTKVGRQVTVTGIFSVTSVSSPLGVLHLTGLPFTCSAGTQFESGVAIFPQGFAASATTSIIGSVQPNTTYVIMYQYAAGVIAALAPNVQAAGDVRISVTYFIAN